MAGAPAPTLSPPAPQPVPPVPAAPPAVPGTPPAVTPKTWTVDLVDGVRSGLVLNEVRDLIRFGTLNPGNQACLDGSDEWMPAGSVTEFTRYFQLANSHAGQQPAGAAAPIGNRTACTRHPAVAATCICTRCGKPFCDDCTVAPQRMRTELKVCPECQVHCEIIEQKPDIIPFWSDIPGIFIYPFRKFGLMMMLICTVLFILASVSIYGALFSFFVWAYALHALRKSADGLMHLPEFQEFSDPFEDLLMPGLRIALASLVSFAPLIAYGIFRGGSEGLFGIVSLFVDPIAWVLVAVALTYYPMVVVIVAIYRSIKPAVNPAAVYQAIAGIMTDYLVMLCFLAVLFVFNVIASFLLSMVPMSMPAEQALRCYTLFVQVHILGRMVYQTQDKVDWY